MMKDSINLFRDWQAGGANIMMPEDQRTNYNPNSMAGAYGGGGGRYPWEGPEAPYNQTGDQ